MKHILIFSYVLSGFLMLSSCAGDTGKGNAHGGESGHGHDHGSANDHMNQSSFEDLVARFEDPERATWQQPEKVFEQMGDISGKTVMEIGSGTGYFSFRAVAKGARVIAADIDERFLNFIKEKRDSQGIEPSVMEIRQIPEDSPGMRPDEVDIAYMVNVYHHIDNRAEYFARLLANLKPGGMLMIIDFKKEDTPHGPPAEMRITSEQVQKELFQAGFPAVQVNDQLLPEQYIVKAYKPTPGQAEQ